jgi:GT2 family glycosyltransferase
VAGNYLAVTGACVMTPRAAFDSVGGLSERLPLNYNDVDYCLKLHAIGLRVVYDPGTLMFHFESASRDTEVADWEKQLYRDRWEAVTAVDPFDNPNFDRRSIHRVIPIGFGRRLARRARRAGRVLAERS